jgi:arylsulfatase B
MAIQMDRRTFLHLITSGLSLTFLGSQCTSYKTGKNPNIVIIVADDLGWNDVSYHGSEIRTPNIDRIAKEGELDWHLDY